MTTPEDGLGFREPSKKIFSGRRNAVAESFNELRVMEVICTTQDRGISAGMSKDIFQSL